jgi:hypothetical protein
VRALAKIHAAVGEVGMEATLRGEEVVVAVGGGAIRNVSIRFEGKGRWTLIVREVATTSVDVVRAAFASLRATQSGPIFRGGVS